MMTQLVPDPWTPVTFKQSDAGIDVGVWGRTYQFCGSPLPTSIVTNGREMLTGPVRLVGELDGEDIQWSPDGAGVILHSRADDQVVLIGHQRCQRLVLNTAMWIEYDGAMFIDVKIMPGEGVDDESPIELPKLHMEIPLTAEAATLFHYWPHRGLGIELDHTTENSGGVPADGMAIPFKPFIWLGWEEGGLSWFTESAKNWQPADADGAIEVVRDGDSVVLRLRLLDSEPVAWKNQVLQWRRRVAPLTFRMGLQATPMKPMVRDTAGRHMAFNFNHQVATTPDKYREGRTVFDRMVDDGVTMAVFHEAWQPIQNYGFSDKVSEVREAVNLCHENGMKVLAYFGYELATLAPEWGDFADDCLAQNPDGVPAGGWRRWPHQRDYVVCTHSDWADELVARIIDAMDTFGFDGLYLDQTNVPFGCCNESHGCGWRDANGNLQPTYPILAAREVMRRLYEVVHARGGWIDLHSSSCCVTPTMSFGHSYYDGEHLIWNEKFSKDPVPNVGLEAFRAEFIGWNFGIPADYMASATQAFPLVHGILDRPLPEKAESRIPVRKALQMFDADAAEFLGYWRKDLPFTAGPAESVKISAYRHADRLLLIVANLSGSDTMDVDVAVDLAAAGLSGAAHDMLDDEAVELTDGRATFSLEPLAMKLIRVE